LFCGIPAVRLFAENVAFWPKVRIPNTNLTKHWYRGGAELNQGLAKSVTAPSFIRWSPFLLVLKVSFCGIHVLRYPPGNGEFRAVSRHSPEIPE
jgi:hypothetical protein